jgi:DNA-binding IclR family transcriptional regulator
MSEIGIVGTAVPGLERGLRILGLFSPLRPAIGAPEMARELKIPRSTVHRIVMTLEGMGFLRRAEAGGYALGPRVLMIGFEYLGSLDILQLANPVLARLRDETDCSTHLAIRNGTDIVYLARHARRSAVTSTVSVGTCLPAHATSMGRILLADLPSDELRALYRYKRLDRFTDQTPTDIDALEALLAEDRSLGVAASASFFERGIASVAAGVRDGSGRVAAAINATTLDGAIDAKRFCGLVRDKVGAAAAEISVLLGAPAVTRSAPSRRRFGT